MPSESISFNILADDKASSSFRSVGDAALGASAKVDIAAASLKLWNDTVQKQGKAATSSLSAFQAHAKATALLADAENVLAGKATTTTKLITDQGTAAGTTASRFSALAGVGGPTGMGAAIAAGVALSPVIATVATGLGGLSLAAYAAAKNTKLMGPVLAPLKGEVNSFTKSLQPQVLGDFAAAAKLAGTVLHGVQPVAAATGKALSGVLGEVGAEFRSGEWQQFFRFMAAQAAPDMRLLGDTFTQLVGTLPTLTQDLQPLARGLLVTADDAAKLTHSLAGMWAAGQQNFPLSTQHTFNALRDLDKWTVDLTNHLPGGHAINNWLSGFQHNASGAGVAAGQAASGEKKLGAAAATAGPSIQSVATATKNLMTAQQNALTAATTYAGDILTTANDGIALEKALDASKNKIGLHTAAQRASFGAANTFITDLANQATQAYNSGHGVDASIAAIKRGLPILDSAKTKNHAYWQEVQILVGWLQKLEQQKQAAFNAKITGQGTWNVQGLPGSLSAHVHGAGHAAGWRVPGHGTGDTVPAMLTPGETVVPKHLTPAVAPLMKAHGVPGFASGGIAGYKGPIAGLQPWGQSSWNKALNLVVTDVAASEAHTFSTALRAAARQAASAARGSGGPSSGTVSALQHYAASLFGQFGWGSSQLGPLIALWNGESGWNRLARNPSSGAFGIPQALPPSKMGTLAASGNAAAQIRWGEGYIHSVYGNPGNAYGTWLSRNPHWYDRGGFLPPGVSMAVNNTGRAERVLGPGDRHETVLRIEGSDQNLIAALVYAMRHHVRVAGGGSVQKALGYQ